MSYPILVPSRSMLVRRISPAPSRSAFLPSEWRRGPYFCGPHKYKHPNPRPFCSAFGINGHDDALRSKTFGSITDKTRLLDGHGIERHFISARVQERADIVDRSDASTHGQWDKHLLGRASHDLEQNRPFLRGGGDIQKDELISAFAGCIAAPIPQDRRRQLN